MVREFDVSTVNCSVFEYLFHQSVNRYGSIIGTSDPDLSYLNRVGGKLLTWHGLADLLIAVNGTVDYVGRVRQHHPDAADFYRFLEASGVGHCGGGNGWYTGNALERLIKLVEEDIAPETLEASTVELGIGRRVNLCLWPKSLNYVDSDPDEATSFACWYNI